MNSTIPVWIAIIAVVGSVVGVLMMLLLAMCTRDKRMEKAQKQWRAERTYDLSRSCHTDLDKCDCVLGPSMKGPRIGGAVSGCPVHDPEAPMFLTRREVEQIEREISDGAERTVDLHIDLDDSQFQEQMKRIRSKIEDLRIGGEDHVGD